MKLVVIYGGDYSELLCDNCVEFRKGIFIETENLRLCIECGEEISKQIEIYKIQGEN